MASSLSSVRDLVSYSNLPIKVLFPSSTLPAVANFKTSILLRLKVSLLFSFFHGRLGSFIVDPCSPFGNLGFADFRNHFFYGVRMGFHGCRTAHVPHRPKADHPLFHGAVVRPDHHAVLGGPDQAVPEEHLSFMGKINGGNLNVFPLYIAPNIQFGPVAYGEYPDVLTVLDLPVEHIEKLRPLVLFVPLPKIVPYRKDTFLGPGLLFIPPGPTDPGIELELLYGIQEGGGLQHVPTGVFAGLFHHLALIDGILDIPDDQFQAQFLHQAVPELNGLRKIMAGI